MQNLAFYKAKYESKNRRWLTNEKRDRSLFFRCKACLSFLKKLKLNKKFSQIRHLRHLAEYMGLNEKVGGREMSEKLAPTPPSFLPDLNFSIHMKAVATGKTLCVSFAKLSMDSQ